MNERGRGTCGYSLQVLYLCLWRQDICESLVPYRIWTLKSFLYSLYPLQTVLVGWVYCFYIVHSLNFSLWLWGSGGGEGWGEVLVSNKHFLLIFLVIIIT